VLDKFGRPIWDHFWIADNLGVGPSMTTSPFVDLVAALLHLEVAARFDYFLFADRSSRIAASAEH